MYNLFSHRRQLAETIKTVKMVRQIRDARYLLTKDMSNEEFMSYIRRKAKPANDQAYEFIKKNKNGKRRIHIFSEDVI